MTVISPEVLERREKQAKIEAAMAAKKAKEATPKKEEKPAEKIEEPKQEEKPAEKKDQGEGE